MRRLFIVGNDAFIVHAMRFALQYAPGVSLFGVIDGHSPMREAIREAQPDIVIVDGITGARAQADRLLDIRDEAPGALIVLLSAPLDEAALQVALDAGAMVCMSTALQAPELVREPAGEPGPVVVAPTPMPAGARTVGATAVEEPVAAEHASLTARELEILRAVAEGYTNARIGRQLWVTEQTVKFHLSNIYRKLGVSNRTEASRYALVHGLVDLTGGTVAEPPQADGPRVRRLLPQAG
jgi:DNA-binding NarL/FixJ family response regulator